jgi:hypothetical protein
MINEIVSCNGMRTAIVALKKTKKKVKSAFSGQTGLFSLHLVPISWTNHVRFTQPRLYLFLHQSRGASKHHHKYEQGNNAPIWRVHFSLSFSVLRFGILNLSF